MPYLVLVEGLTFEPGLGLVVGVVDHSGIYLFDSSVNQSVIVNQFVIETLTLLLVDLAKSQMRSPYPNHNFLGHDC